MRFACLLIALLCWSRPGCAAALDSGDNPWLARDLSRAEVLPPLVRGADYLVRQLLPNGQFVYLQDPLGRCCKGSGDRYSVIRHLGAVYALLRTYETTREPRFLAAAEQALAFLGRFRAELKTGSVLRSMSGGLSLGENGFMLVDVLLDDRLRGEPAHAALAAGLARFIGANLRYGGRYATPEGWGESQAAIGLTQFLAAPNGAAAMEQHHLDAALHAWLRATMGGGTPSHWTVQAVRWYAHTHPGADRELAAYGVASARTLLAGVPDGASGAPGRQVGARDGKLYSCNATARAEGLMAAYFLARELDRPADAAFFFARAREHLAFGLQFQYGTSGAFDSVTPRLERVGRLFELDGGVMGDAVGGTVRIDYVAHLVRALASYLEAPSVPGDLGVSMSDLM